ncbi:MAG: hypothetical protein GX868_02630 [Actinobacteria bacterium]|nr:hypothetical protein [Actinomycetota bacterium]
MMLPVWSAKAGAGCTTVSLALAGRVTKRFGACLLVDLGGDVPAAIGMDEPIAGVTDWLASAHGDAPALHRLERPAGPSGLDVVALGDSMSWACPRDLELVECLRDDARPVVVDVGDRFGSRSDSLTRLRNLVASEPQSVLVVRACYLEFRRILRHELQPDVVVFVRENGRSLDRLDVKRLLGAPVIVEIDHDPAVGRAVDDGTMLRRTPKLLGHQMEALVSR